jgi:ribosomal protein S18 acetylase RimI-like enzyme
MRADAREPAIRPATPADEAFLRRMLWIAVQFRESDPPPAPAVEPPELSKYTQGFGRRGDRGFVAMCDDEAVGAAWCRLLTASDPGYGYVADDVPELSVAVLPGHRGKGLGGRLIVRLTTDLAAAFDAVSLSVVPDNPARRLYERLGFVKVGELEHAWTMVKPLDAERSRAPTRTWKVIPPSS